MAHSNNPIGPFVKSCICDIRNSSKTDLFDHAILSYRTMFAHHDNKTNGAMIDWTRVERSKFEFVLISIHE